NVGTRARNNRSAHEPAERGERKPEPARPNDFKLADVIDRDDRLAKPRSHGGRQAPPGRIAQHVPQSMPRLVGCFDRDTAFRDCRRDNGDDGDPALARHGTLPAYSPITFAIFWPSRIILSSVFRGMLLMESYQRVSVSRNSS